MRGRVPFTGARPPTSNVCRCFSRPDRMLGESSILLSQASHQQANHWHLYTSGLLVLSNAPGDTYCPVGACGSVWELKSFIDERVYPMHRQTYGTIAYASLR